MQALLLTSLVRDAPRCYWQETKKPATERSWKSAERAPMRCMRKSRSVYPKSRSARSLQIPDQPPGSRVESLVATPDLSAGFGSRSPKLSPDAANRSGASEREAEHIRAGRSSSQLCVRAREFLRPCVVVHTTLLGRVPKAESEDPALGLMEAISNPNVPRHKCRRHLPASADRVLGHRPRMNLSPSDSDISVGAWEEGSSAQHSTEASVSVRERERGSLRRSDPSYTRLPESAHIAVSFKLGPSHEATLF
ncbi:hypothetical protein OF83DRAFT_73263 [Amylostereum chailletii]|nr:hypothetical protein OF83DRAFT_73263 [Amylostereum chailletii]